MFSHYDRKGKCEWLDGGLEKFVLHYNGQMGTNYIHTECLDLVRIAGTTPKQPEVLLTDPNNLRRMVIERKSVVWPLDFIHRHNNGHIFANAVYAETREAFRDALYELTVSGKAVDEFDKKTAEGVGKQLGSRIATISPSQLPLRGVLPISWSLAQVDDYENPERKGLVVQSSDPVNIFETSEDDAKVGTASAMQHELGEASLKFIDYSDAVRLVLLDFFGEELTEDDIVALTPTVSIPPNIDEVWMTIRDWVSHDDYEIGYQRLFLSRRGASTFT